MGKGSDLISTVLQYDSKISRAAVVMAARVSEESRSSDKSVVMMQVQGQAGKSSQQDRVVIRSGENNQGQIQ